MTDAPPHVLSLVARLARVIPAGVAPDPGPWPAVDEWPMVVEAARHHGLAPLVWHNLPEHQRVTMPKGARESLAHTARAQVVFAHKAAGVAVSVIRALRAGGLEPLLLKGLAFAERLYPFLGARPVADVDLLVSAAEFDRALAALQTIGPVPPPAGRLESRAVERSVMIDGVMVDLHRWLTHPERFPIEHAGLLARSRRDTLLGTPVCTLGNEDTLLSLALHMAGHRFETRLKWLLDVHEIVTQWALDWSSVLARARAARMTAVLHIALQAAHANFGTAIPSEVLSGTRPSRWRDAWLAGLLDPATPEVSRRRGPPWVRRAALFLPLADQPLRTLPFALRHEALRVLDLLAPRRGLGPHLG